MKSNLKFVNLMIVPMVLWSWTSTTWIWTRWSICFQISNVLRWSKVWINEWVGKERRRISLFWLQLFYYRRLIEFSSNFKLVLQTDETSSTKSTQFSSLFDNNLEYLAGNIDMASFQDLQSMPPPTITQSIIVTIWK